MIQRKTLARWLSYLIVLFGTSMVLSSAETSCPLRVGARMVPFNRGWPRTTVLMCQNTALKEGTWPRIEEKNIPGEAQWYLWVCFVLRKPRKPTWLESQWEMSRDRSCHLKRVPEKLKALNLPVALPDFVSGCRTKFNHSSQGPKNMQNFNPWSPSLRTHFSFVSALWWFCRKSIKSSPVKPEKCTTVAIE